jgi:hypothetical protein
MKTKRKLSDSLTVDKKLFGCIFYSDLVKKPIMAKFGINMVDDGSELFNSLCEKADFINIMEVNDQFYHNMNRDNDNEKSIIIRLE